MTTTVKPGDANSDLLSAVDAALSSMGVLCDACDLVASLARDAAWMASVAIRGDRISGPAIDALDQLVATTLPLQRSVVETERQHLFELRERVKLIRIAAAQKDDDQCR